MIGRLLDCVLGVSMFASVPLWDWLRESRQTRNDRRYVRGNRAF